MESKSIRDLSIIKSYVLAALFALLIPFNFAVCSEESKSSDKEDSSELMESEYEKLMKIVQTKRAAAITVDKHIDILDHPGIGSKNAAVVLIEFGDFQCPFCRRHLLDTAQRIHDQLVSTDQVRYIFFDFPIETKHPLAAKAAVAAHCAEEQGKYWEMRNVLYRNQKAIHEMFLVSHAKTAGLDKDVFSDCLESGRYDSAIKHDQMLGHNLGITATPTFFVGINKGGRIQLVRKIQGAQPYELFEREIQNAKSEVVELDTPVH